MGWFILSKIFSVLIAIVSLGRISEQDKDLEITPIGIGTMSSYASN